ncbi:MAG: phosphate ABC transporter substrate-binding protein [Sinimarinibacterium sp.]|jgi:phosphate transport system substrate-binding protein
MAHESPWMRLALALVVLALFACSEPSAPAPTHADRLHGKLVITGSSTVAPLVAEIGKRFESLHPDVRVDVQTGGSSRGIADARQGLADIGMASRALKSEESDLHGFAIARDGVAVILNAANPVPALTDDQVVAIYTGRITRWSEVGGADAPITVVNKAEGRSTLELFLHYFKIESPAVKAHVVIGDNEQGIKTVAGNPDAIGYVSVGAAEYSAAHGVPIKLLPMKGVVAAIATVKDGSFPLSRPLNLVTKAEPAGLAQAFIDYARSPAVHDLVEQLYFVALES